MRSRAGHEPSLRWAGPRRCRPGPGGRRAPRPAAGRGRRPRSRWPSALPGSTPTMREEAVHLAGEPPVRRPARRPCAAGSAYASPSSRSTSCSAVRTMAGGRPARSAARSGEASGLRAAGGVGGVVVPEPDHRVRGSAAAGSSGSGRRPRRGRSRSPGRRAPAGRSPGRRVAAPAGPRPRPGCRPRCRPPTISGTAAPGDLAAVLVRPAQRRPGVVDGGRDSGAPAPGGSRRSTTAHPVRWASSRPSGVVRRRCRRHPAAAVVVDDDAARAVAGDQHAHRDTPPAARTRASAPRPSRARPGLRRASRRAGRGPPPGSSRAAAWPASGHLCQQRGRRPRPAPSVAPVLDSAAACRRRAQVEALVAVAATSSHLIR